MSGRRAGTGGRGAEARGGVSPANAFRRALEGLLPHPSQGPWIAALSGGCDSTALCRLLHENAGREGGRVPPPASIRAVHVHHGLRGVEADRDEEASGALAAGLGFSFQSARITPPAGLAPGAVEKWARAERYRVLLEAAAACDASLVLTGHNRNDQAETVLLRVLHGAGYWGLAGIRPVRPVAWGSPVLLARPLLGFTRAELAAYLEALGQPFRHDGTNEEISFERNRVRLRLLPLLEEAAGPSLAADLEGIAAAALSLHTFVDDAAARILDRWAGRARGAPGPSKGKGLGIVMPLDPFLAVPEPVRFSLLRLASHRAAPRQVPLSGAAYAAIIDALAGSRPGRPSRQEWALGRGAVLRRKGRTLVVERDIAARKSARAPASGFDLDLDVPGTAALPDGSCITASSTSDLESVRAFLSRRRPPARSTSARAGRATPFIPRERRGERSSRHSSSTAGSRSRNGTPSPWSAATTRSSGSWGTGSARGCASRAPRSASSSCAARRVGSTRARPDGPAPHGDEFQGMKKAGLLSRAGFVIRLLVRGSGPTGFAG